MKILTGLTATAALIAAISFANAQSTAPGTATGAMMDCSDANMKSANDSMMKMTDATKKAAATKEMDTAKEMMAKKDMAGCKTHMGNAMGMMK